jgi:pimeloyl-ACP methyl ester carboxylesterase
VDAFIASESNSWNRPAVVYVLLITMPNRIGVCLWALGVWLLSCPGSVPADHEPQATFVISPNPALMDDRITIRVMGLHPNREVTIRARSRDQRDCWWHSSAVFRARQDGSIDVSAQAPTSGAYTGVDAMGLFWSMVPDRSRLSVPAFFSVVDWFKPIVTEIDAVSDHRVTVGTTQVVRHFAGTGVRAETFRNDGVVGILYRPGDNRKRHGVILLGGSEGGFPGPEGAMLASRGFVVLALAYFGASGLPATMQRIPVEYFGRAIHAMQSLPEIGGGAVTMIGASRGAEGALLVGSTYPEINGVVGVSSSHVLWEGATARMLPGGPAWTNGDRPLPYVPLHIGPVFAARYVWSTVSGSSISLKPMFLDSLSRVATDDVHIPVERIQGPVLLVSGSDDKKWPSALMSARAIERLRRNHHPYGDELVTYERTGHWIPSAYLPTGGLRGRMADEIGGTPNGSASAQRQWWPKMLQFLAAIPSERETR